jgi:hypothetical protein
MIDSRAFYFALIAAHGLDLDKNGRAKQSFSAGKARGMRNEFGST